MLTLKQQEYLQKMEELQNKPKVEAAWNEWLKTSPLNLKTDRVDPELWKKAIDREKTRRAAEVENDINKQVEAYRAGLISKAKIEDPDAIAAINEEEQRKRTVMLNWLRGMNERQEEAARGHLKYRNCHD